MLALGFVFLSPSVHAEDMAIRADKSAPGNQQPTKYFKPAMVYRK